LLGGRYTAAEEAIDLVHSLELAHLVVTPPRSQRY
jgi:hypothetical protein